MINKSFATLVSFIPSIVYTDYALCEWFSENNQEIPKKYFYKETKEFLFYSKDIRNLLR